MNTYLKQRLEGILEHFRAGHLAGGVSASANRGTEREAFLLAFLSQVLPPIYRAGTGEIMDIEGNQSGQVDVVIEMPWAPSFGFPGSPVRLYPAEAVGVAIEIKSNVKAQWAKVDATVASLARLRQRLSGSSITEEGLEIHNVSIEPLPVFAVGYRGWKSPAPIEKKLLSSELDGVLILEDPLFVESDRLATYRKICAVEEQASLGAHKRIMELAVLGHDVGAIVTKLNVEGFISSRVHLGDERYLPNVAANAWTSADVEASMEVLRRKTMNYTGTEALFAFLRRVHTELSKRAGMDAKLSLYG
jgi:hypothetical protein